MTANLRTIFSFGFPNASRPFIDFSEEPVGRRSRILAALPGLNVNLGCTQRHSPFCGQGQSDLIISLEPVSPEHSRVPQGVEVRWRP
jgi:hypothetical protein